MKYAFFPTWYYTSFPTEWAGYKVPIYASDRVYNQMPGHNEPDSILAEGSENGYDTISALYKEVCDALTFNPFTVTEYYLTSAAVNDDFMTGLIDAFTGTYSPRDGAYNGFNPEPSGSGSAAEDLIGYCVLDASAKHGTNAFTGANFNGDSLFLSRLLPITQFTTDDGIEYDFEVWPESGIENGYIDFSHFFKHEGNYRFCWVKLFIYFRDSKYYWYIKLHNKTVNNNTWLDNKLQDYELEHIYEPDNPYDDHQKDGNEGGNGGFDNDADPVPVPDLPDLDITAAGGLKLYRLRPTDFAALMSYLLSHEPGEAILKWFQNPIQGIVSCYVLPYPVKAVGSGDITVLGLTTGVTGYKADQWTEYDMGGVNVDFGFGNTFLDYSPWTKVSIYLPFIGIRQLNTDEVVGKRVGVHYQFDNVSGSCIAFVTVGNAVRYSFAGSCACGIPLAQSNWGQFYIAAATTAAGALAGAVGGTAAAFAEGKSMADIAGAGIGGAVQGGGNLGGLNAKPTISRSGAISGAGAELGVPYPYLIIERPDKAKVSNPAPVTGLTCGRTLSLGSLTGYNIIEHVHLHGIAATGPELDEIERLLYEGAIF